ncbi:hypothetical protein D3C86_1993900 [compost metagenome]
MQTRCFQYGGKLFHSFGHLAIYFAKNSSLPGFRTELGVKNIIFDVTACTRESRKQPVTDDFKPGVVTNGVG